MFLESILSVSLIHFLAVASPGPDFAIVTRNSIQSGRASGLATSVGVVCANLVQIFIALSGLGVALQQSPNLLSAIKFSGAAFLGWTGIRCMQSQGFNEIAISSRLTQGNALAAFLSGFGTSVLNPKAILYFISILAQFIQAEPIPSNRPWYGIAVLAVSIVWFGGLAFLVSDSTFRKRFIAASLWIDRVMGIVLLAFALKIVAG